MVNLTKAPKVNLTKANVSRWAIDPTTGSMFRNNNPYALQVLLAFRAVVQSNNPVALHSYMKLAR
ncbi:hypothetical protein BJD55_gp025 [Gordonia phage Yvonnetastic]|uniref:Uncharacterized protein n=1 Tax=Gordonia phage Yvonnetastic TaxID=1821566 RepID=A0A142K9F8_9CAUD|nr:hypothetical protein BJD55_gp025 [Gordonia phage Yvonnetastic]AMS02741.1 hypothetical protein SEA_YVONNETASTIC_197 [Gordonia phage Yvonnetastic]WKW86169.1 hypothetical protein SEA_JONJAMES_196 [Gordonia Phage JonJames]